MSAEQGLVEATKRLLAAGANPLIGPHDDAADAGGGGGGGNQQQSSVKQVAEAGGFAEIVYMMEVSG